GRRAGIERDAVMWPSTDTPATGAAVLAGPRGGRLRRGQPGHYWIPENLAEERERPVIIRKLVEAIQQEEVEAIATALARIDGLHCWGPAFRALARVQVPHRLRPRLASALWSRAGDHIRQEVRNDRILIAGLRAVCPPYRGHARRLFRGEGAW